MYILRMLESKIKRKKTIADAVFSLPKPKSGSAVPYEPEIEKSEIVIAPLRDRQFMLEYVRTKHIVVLKPVIMASISREGFPCSLQGALGKQGKHMDIFILPEKADKPKDYYIPYVDNGYGSVSIPDDASNGTIVVTETFNGCRFRIHKKEGALCFIHDKADTYPGFDSADVATIPKEKYCNNLAERVRNFCDLRGVDISKVLESGTTMIALKTDNMWHIYKCTWIQYGPKAEDMYERLPPLTEPDCEVIEWVYDEKSRQFVDGEKFIHSEYQKPANFR